MARNHRGPVLLLRRGRCRQLNNTRRLGRRPSLPHLRRPPRLEPGRLRPPRQLPLPLLRFPPPQTRRSHFTNFQPHGLAGSSCRLITPDSDGYLQVKLPGLYNAYNLAAAVACRAGSWHPNLRRQGHSRNVPTRFRPCRDHSGSRDDHHASASQEPDRSQPDAGPPALRTRATGYAGPA